MNGHHHHRLVVAAYDGDVDVDDRERDGKERSRRAAARQRQCRRERRWFCFPSLALSSKILPGRFAGDRNSFRIHPISFGIANATTHNLESSSTPLSVFVELYAKQLIIEVLDD
ncbi:hypothetical protein Hanom_Chr14g01328821 [Helianthus anomalus]